MSKTHSILIIDDDKTSFILLNKILHSKYTVYAAKSGVEGLQMAKKHIPDIILLDVLMPGMNGYEVFSALREDEDTKDIPVIFITGLTDELDIEKGLSLGAVDYIPKPFSSTIVKLRVDNQIKVAQKHEDAMNAISKEYLDMIEYRDSMLIAVNQAAALLFNIDIESFEEKLHSSAQIIAKAVSIDCVYCWENKVINNKRLCSRVFEWTPDLTVYSTEETYSYNELIPGWEDKLSSGTTIISKGRDLPARDKMHLIGSGVKAVLIVPIFIKNQFWGFVGFNDIHHERVFTDNEVSILISASYLLANAFARNEMFKDIKETTEQLEVALEQAHAASKSKSDFLATMSHEIRTPMNAIIGLAQIEIQKDELPEEYLESMEKIYFSGVGLLGIINDVLDLSKIETGKMELNPSKYDLPSLINDSVQLNAMRIGTKPIEFIIDVDENLPAKLYGDELRLKQILNNLLSNAIKYTSKGHVKLTVTHLPRERDTDLRFIVEDTGRGISKNDQKKLFTRFSRFDAAKSVEEGVGLGLNIVKSLLTLMDGVIEVESEYNKGSTFTVTVKQKLIRSKKIGPRVSEKLSSFTFLRKNQYKKQQILHELMPYGKVLIVDDVESNLYVAHGLLSAYQLKIDTSESGFDAIDKIKNGAVYDIIFMDHMMPQMDGLETTRELRKMGYDAPIVALTANAIVGNEKMFLSNGFDGFISKPIDMRVLNTILNKFIRDRYFKEGTTNTPDDTGNSENLYSSKNKLLLKSFQRDAIKAVENLQNIERSLYLSVNTDIDLKPFITTAHAMKSALGNIGENDKSRFAYEMEVAGINNDKDFITENIENFIDMLESLLDDLSPNEQTSPEETYVDEDSTYLNEHLEIFISACNDYDDSKAFTVLDSLKQKKWKNDTLVELDNLNDILFLESDFETAAEKAKQLITVK